MTSSISTPSHTDQYVAELLTRGRTLTWITQRSTWTREQLLTIAKAHALTHVATADSCNPDAPTAGCDSVEVDNLLVGLDRAARNHPQHADEYRERRHASNVAGLTSALRQALKSETCVLDGRAQLESVRQAAADLNARLAERRAARGNRVKR